MSATLVCRPGDVQALKAVAAATATNTPVEIIPLSDGKWKKLVSDDTAAPLSLREIFLILAAGSTLTEPNAIARYLGASLVSPSDLNTESWIEWEFTILRPAAYSQDITALNTALQRLSTSLTANTYLSGGEAGLADFIVAPTLRAAQLAGHTLPTDITTYITKVLGSPAMTTALQSITPESSIVTADISALAENRPRLPIPGARNILITSALPYVNNVPHLGNIIGCVLSADVYARYCRSRGYNCIYVCGTDEYGTATETKALEEGLSCQEICDKYHAIHKSIYEWFDISFDKFGRTPSRAQTEIGHEIFRQLDDNDFLVEQTMEQLYSEPLQKFLADRFVIGICPKCKYEDARGDQCDQCGSLLNPTELINPKCKLTGTTPVVKETKHIFLDLPKLSEDLQAYITKTSQLGGWTSNCVQTTKAWMDQGLKVRCITRDLKWGTPVPKTGYENKVFYVWFDAPIGYISITAGYCGEDWRKWWMNPDDVEMVQFMGKDNVPFHTVIFPATQLGTKQPWTMMKSISVTEYLNYEDGKFSKSRGVGVFGNDAKDTGLPVEMWRYYLLALRPESQDSAFQWDDFAVKNNAELNDNLGNFVNRTLKFIYARFEKTVPGPKGNAGEEAIAALGVKLSALVKQYLESMEAIRMKEALKTAMLVSKAGNAFFQETEIWVAYKQNPDACAGYISACAGVALLAASMLQPFMPSLTEKLLTQLGVTDNKPLSLTDDLIDKAASPASLLPAGHQIAEAEPTPLFRKITDDEVAELRSRFAGSQEDRKAAAANGGDGGGSSSDKKKGVAAAASKGAAVKGDKKAKGGAAQQQASGAGKKTKPADDAPVDISRVDLRCGFIAKAWRHPDAESLYIEEVDVGEEQPRTVVSGLVKYIPAAEMQQRRVVLVCNLKPANMRGVRSEAMVLAATSEDGNSVELVEPPEGSVPGEKVFVEGYPGDADEQLNPKKKIWEAVQPELKTDGEKQACYKGVALRTSKGVCVVKSIIGGGIK